MASTHKLVREAVRTVMSDPVYGFNQALATALQSAGIGEVLQLDWTDQSSNVFWGVPVAEDQPLSKLKGRLQLYISTSGSQWSGETKGMKWSGRIDARLDFIIRYSHRDDDADVAEQNEVVSLAEAVEDAVIEVFARSDIDWGVGLAYNRPPESAGKPPAELLEDGWEQELPITVGFAVDVAY